MNSCIPFYNFLRHFDIFLTLTDKQRGLSNTALEEELKNIINISFNIDII